MDVQEILSQARDAMTARRVFGEPIERDGMMLIPVASVMGGAGGGSGRAAGRRGDTGEGSATAEGGATAEGAPTADEGSGYGFGMMARPLGVYVVRGEAVTWEPAVDRNRQLMLGAIVGMLAILAARSVLLTIVRR